MQSFWNSLCYSFPNTLSNCRWTRLTLTTRLHTWTSFSHPPPPPNTHTRTHTCMNTHTQTANYQRLPNETHVEITATHIVHGQTHTRGSVRVWPVIHCYSQILTSENGWYHAFIYMHSHQSTLCVTLLTSIHKLYSYTCIFPQYSVCAELYRNTLQ